MHLHIPAWKNKQKDLMVASLSRAAMDGASSEELSKAALLILQKSGNADRLGVWLQNDEDCQQPNHHVIFRGLIWDRENADTPQEWARLAPEYPLPPEVVNGEASVIIDLEKWKDHPIIGPVIGMRTVLWMPVGERHTLRGLIMSAVRGKSRYSSDTGYQRVAEDLSLALAYQQAQRESCQLRSDLVAQQTLAQRTMWQQPPADNTSGTRLLQTEKLAAVGQMVSGVAHELSNPLTTILGYAQRLLKREESSGTAGEGRQIFHEAERAVKILRQLQPSLREAAAPRSKVSLNRVVLQTMEMQRVSISPENVRTELELDPLRPTVWGVADQLQQVLVNLVSNACQAILESGKSGVIRVRTKLLRGTRALLEVSDNGPGIPASVAARIFDPFFTTKQPGGGVGLGLSIVREIVREHSGQMSVDSPAGGGTKFLIEWRAVPAGFPKPEWLWPAYSGELSSRPKPAADPPRQPNVRAHVLVVEDEPTVARLIADVLEEEGHHVDVTFSGHEALERASGAQYDLAICDIKMPGLDGQHFFTALARAENPLRERLLFVTGDGASPRTREFLELHSLPYVAKPFRVEELSAAVRKILTAAGCLSGANPMMPAKFGANNE